MQKRGKRNRRGGKRNTRKAIVVVNSRRDPSFPPQNKSKPYCTRVIRYVGQGSSNAVYPVTRRCLLNTVLAVVNGSTAATNVYESVRLDRVCMWNVPDAADGFGITTEELVLTWTGDRAPDLRLSDRGTLSHPACIKSRPPAGSLAGFWSTVNGDLDETLFTYSTTGTPTVIDIHLTLCIGDGATKTCVIAAAAVTGIAYAALDNAVPAGTVGSDLFRPDSLTWADMTTP